MRLGVAHVLGAGIAVVAGSLVHLTVAIVVLTVAGVGLDLALGGADRGEQRLACDQTAGARADTTNAADRDLGAGLRMLPGEIVVVAVAGFDLRRGGVLADHLAALARRLALAGADERVAEAGGRITALTGDGAIGVGGAGRFAAEREPRGLPAGHRLGQYVGLAVAVVVDVVAGLFGRHRGVAVGETGLGALAGARAGTEAVGHAARGLLRGGLGPIRAGALTRRTGGVRLALALLDDLADVLVEHVDAGIARVGAVVVGLARTAAEATGRAVVEAERVGALVGAVALLLARRAQRQELGHADEDHVVVAHVLAGVALLATVDALLGAALAVGRVDADAVVAVAVVRALAAAAARAIEDGVAAVVAGVAATVDRVVAAGVVGVVAAAVDGSAAGVDRVPGVVGDVAAHLGVVGHLTEAVPVGIRRRIGAALRPGLAATAAEREREHDDGGEVPSGTRLPGSCKHLAPNVAGARGRSRSPVGSLKFTPVESTAT